MPLTGLSFFSVGTDLASQSLTLTCVAVPEPIVPALVGMAGFAGLAALARGSWRRTAPRRGGP